MIGSGLNTVGIVVRSMRIFAARISGLIKLCGIRQVCQEVFQNKNLLEYVSSRTN